MDDRLHAASQGKFTSLEISFSAIQISLLSLAYLIIPSLLCSSLKLIHGAKGEDPTNFGRHRICNML